MKSYPFLTALLCISLVGGMLSGCSRMDAPTPIPTEFLPTAIAQTLEAQRFQASGAEETSAPGSEADLAGTPQAENILPEFAPTPAPTFTPELVPTLSPEQALATLMSTTPLTPTHTPVPSIPAAGVQIYRLGDHSRIVSPFRVNMYVSALSGKQVSIELLGEDGRLLMRQLKSYKSPIFEGVSLSADLEFQISAAAELGRLVVSVEDEHNRLISANSVNLVLLSTGETDLNPTSTFHEALVIQEPLARSLIQGGVLLVSGVARPYSAEPLRLQLVTNDGRIVGERLAGVTVSEDGSYTPFAAEIPYSVDQLTPARLIVFEVGGEASAISHLNSVEVLLSP